MISSTNNRKILKGGGGTRQGELSSENGLMPISVDTLIEEYNIQNISLIKSDVDGWDWDVINSAKSVLRLNRPILFFEMMITDNEILSEYKRMIDSISKLGYSQFYIFDCFGAFMQCTVDPANVSQLGDYLLSQYRSETTRSIYYVDIMCGWGDSLIMNRAVESYSTWIRG